MQFVKTHMAVRQCLLCKFSGTVTQSFKSYTGGRNGLSLQQREKEERSGGMGRQKGWGGVCSEGGRQGGRGVSAEFR